MMADHDTVLRLLKTARGQMDGIIKMVEEDRYCIDISTQVMPVTVNFCFINTSVFPCKKPMNRGKWP